MYVLVHKVDREIEFLELFNLSPLGTLVVSPFIGWNLEVPDP